MASGCKNQMCVCGAAGVPWACKCTCSRCAWARQVAVDPAMSFSDKQEELELLGASYKWLFQEGGITKIHDLNVRRSHDLILERARRITQSMTLAEREVAVLLSPQPKPAHVVPGTTALIAKLGDREDMKKSVSKKPPRGESA